MVSSPRAPPPCPHPDYDPLQSYSTGPIPNLLGYSVGFCHRFGGGVNATAVNPLSGTLYVADNARYRVLCFQPEFQFSIEPMVVRVGRPTVLLAGTGGLAPLKFAVAGGSLPNGLKLDPGTGVISGTPVGEAGESVVRVVVQSALRSLEGELRITVVIPP